MQTFCNSRFQYALHSYFSHIERFFGPEVNRGADSIHVCRFHSVDEPTCSFLQSRIASLTQHFFKVYQIKFLFGALSERS